MTMRLDDFERGKLSVHAAAYIADLEVALKQIAKGRKVAPSGSQRICREEIKTMARETCARLGIDWQS